MSKISSKIAVKGVEIALNQSLDKSFISITDIAKYKNPEAPADIIKNWMRSKNTIELLGLWEKLHNPKFKLVEFDRFKNEAGYNHFVLSPKKWIDATAAIGLQSQSGRYGGTYAHIDIALEFASWISVEFKFYLLKEFQRLKEQEALNLDWNIRRSLTKINYRIHTDAIKENIIPQILTRSQSSRVYASEADVLNMALFGLTAKQWQEQNPEQKGNMRDYANVTQLVCLANLEMLNALWINEGFSQEERLVKLNQVAIEQTAILLRNTTNKAIKRQIDKETGN